ncbi:GntR family transcriptional regulator [Brevibacillus agri]|uniref:GntR family transcriptional regulator n=1 Tax=Brevibacillus agri TaxID=51101 RepID=UPI003D242454
MIENGLYPENSKLPSESELSHMRGISRMTLRQALLLLQEDRYIVMRLGSGSYVSKVPSEKRAGLEKNTNPVYTSSQYGSNGLESRELACKGLDPRKERQR